jgi:hypothetical protein
MTETNIFVDETVAKTRVEAALRLVWPTQMNERKATQPLVLWLGDERERMEPPEIVEMLWPARRDKVRVDRPNSKLRRCGWIRVCLNRLLWTDLCLEAKLPSKVCSPE